MIENESIDRYAALPDKAAPGTPDTGIRSKPVSNNTERPSNELIVLIRTLPLPIKKWLNILLQAKAITPGVKHMITFRIPENS